VRFWEENPDLPYAFIEDVIKGKADMDNGDVSLFEFCQSLVTDTMRYHRFPAC
jgi:hypothetical protein